MFATFDVKTRKMLIIVNKIIEIPQKEEGKVQRDDKGKVIIQDIISKPESMDISHIMNSKVWMPTEHEKKILDEKHGGQSMLLIELKDANGEKYKKKILEDHEAFINRCHELKKRIG